jgi:chromosome segregation ATPase
VGRFENLSEYVRAGSSESVVEVELFGGSAGDRNTVVKRKFDNTHGSRSKFYVNEKHVTKDDVIEMMQKKFNIQINNLCVYLAQFRVGEFAELKHEGLLEETEKAGHPKLFEQHQRMKKLLENQRLLETGLSAGQKNLERLRTEKQGMEADMKAQEERADMQKKIEILKQRLPWCQWQDKNAEVHKKKILL